MGKILNVIMNMLELTWMLALSICVGLILYFMPEIKIDYLVMGLVSLIILVGLFINSKISNQRRKMKIISNIVLVMDDKINNLKEQISNIKIPAPQMITKVIETPGKGKKKAKKEAYVDLTNVNKPEELEIVKPIESKPKEKVEPELIIPEE